MTAIQWQNVSHLATLFCYSDLTWTVAGILPPVCTRRPVATSKHQGR